MFDPKSRYNQVEEAVYTAPDGTRIPYKKRRFPPSAPLVSWVSSVAVLPAERLDMLATRTLGDPLLFWRICDANVTRDPFDLVAEPNRRLNVPLIQIPGGT